MTQPQPSTLAQKTASRPPVPRTSTQQTSGTIQVVYKSYTPHSTAWFDQAIRRYGSEQAKIREVQQIAKKDPYLCFQCTTIYHLADYYVRGDKTQTFRYCENCAVNVEQAGTDIVLIQAIEEPEAEPAPQEEEIDDQSQVSKQTIELPETMIATPRGRLSNMHPTFYVGLALFVVALAWIAMLIAPGIWNKIHYGNPPMTETDAVVGHHDSSAHPSHFIATNDNGTILVIEMMGGDPGHSIVYVVARTSDTTDPAFIQFDGNTTPNMYIYVGQVVFFMSNNGSQFKTH